MRIASGTSIASIALNRKKTLPANSTPMNSARCRAGVVNGFGDTVTFLTGRTTLRRFSFGTLGCFGYGQFPVGVDPYGISFAPLTKSVPVSATGAFKITSAAATYSGDNSTKLKVSVTGQFSTATSAKGTISLIETGPNGGSCGPVKMTFTATPRH